MMQTFIVSILAAATVIRILLVSSYCIGGGSGDILSQVLGPGILPAISASVLDPIHTWDHLAEACFWLDNTPSIWTTDINHSIYHVGGYRAIYTPGTRIVAPPLVVAFLGETLVCPDNNNNNLLFYLRKVIQAILLLVADIIGAYCIFHLGKRVLDMEDMTNEAEMERQTILSDQIITNDGEDKCNSSKQLVIPGILRPERGWIVDLPSKILPPEKVLMESLLNDDAVSNGNGVSSTIILDDRDPLILINDLPLVVAVLYYCNPISIIANANGSLRGLWDSFILISFYYATMPSINISKEGVPTKVKSATMVALYLSVAIYADVGYVAFMVPILLWRGLCASTKTKGTTFQRTQHFDWKLVYVLFIISTGALHYLASLLVGGDSSAYKTVLIQTVLPNVAFVQQDGSGSVPGPSMGLHWYMFVQMFDRFRPYFTVFVSGIPAMFIIPLTIRLHRYPSVLVSLCLSHVTFGFRFLHKQ
jgi:phosphatidylinositol glycan class U